MVIQWDLMVISWDLMGFIRRYDGIPSGNDCYIAIEHGH